MLTPPLPKKKREKKKRKMFCRGGQRKNEMHKKNVPLTELYVATAYSRLCCIFVTKFYYTSKLVKSAHFPPGPCQAFQMSLSLTQLSPLLTLNYLPFLQSPCGLKSRCKKSPLFDFFLFQVLSLPVYYVQEIRYRPWRLQVSRNLVTKIPQEQL